MNKIAWPVPRIEIMPGEETDDERGKGSGRCDRSEDSGVDSDSPSGDDDRRVLLPLGGGKDSLVAWHLCQSEDRLQPVLMYVCDGDDEYDRSWRLQGLVHKHKHHFTAKLPLISTPPPSPCTRLMSALSCLPLPCNTNPSTAGTSDAAAAATDKDTPAAPLGEARLGQPALRTTRKVCLIRFFVLDETTRRPYTTLSHVLSTHPIHTYTYTYTYSRYQGRI